MTMWAGMTVDDRSWSGVGGRCVGCMHALKIDRRRTDLIGERIYWTEEGHCVGLIL